MAGEESDGFVTNELNPQLLQERLLPAVKMGAEKAGKDYDSIDKAIFMPASYDEDKQKALDSIRFWRGAMIKAFFEVDYPDPRKIEESAQVVGMETMEKMAFVISNPEEGIKKLEKYSRLGFTDIVLINSSPDRGKLVKLISEQIAPEFAKDEKKK